MHTANPWTMRDSHGRGYWNRQQPHHFSSTLWHPRTSTIKPTILCCLWWRLDPPLAPHLGTFVPLDLYARNWWRGAQYLANQFWVRWKREYRQNLQDRPKWQKRKHNLSVGDIVLVKEDNTNRNDWSLRRISVLVRITDVKVRRAQVTSYRTGNAKIYEQPISSFNILMKWEEEA